MLKKKLLAIGLAAAFFLTGCVDQHPDGESTVQDIPKIENPRVVSTSVATTEILYKLDVDLVGVPDSNVSKLPKKYDDCPRIGMAMSPDIEEIKGLNPDWVFSPVSLVSDLQPKYENARLRYGFLNLNNVPGMYESIKNLGDILNRQEEAAKLIKEYEDFMHKYNESHKNKEKPRVLVLMGLPGSYVVATDKSYVGSLVKLAGGKNVYDSDTEQFLNINTEDMLKKDPDIILRTAHAMPEQVLKMFRDEFKTNDIWSHFRAVKEDKVYDLNYKTCGMSANFKYPKALKDIDKILYGGE